MTWLHRSYKHYIQITRLRIIRDNKSHHSSNDITQYDATICQILKTKLNNIHWVLCYRHLFTSLCRLWNWFLIWPRKWKKEEKRKMEVIRTSALKLVYPRGGSTCPLKISNAPRSSIENETDGENATCTRTCSFLND